MTEFLLFIIAGLLGFIMWDVMCIADDFKEHVLKNNTKED